jgi:acetyltransferase
MDAMNNFFNPSSVAIMGITPKRGNVGKIILDNLIYGSKKNELKNIRGGFKGKIFPINPDIKEISGLKVFSSLIEVPTTVDLAILCIHPAGITDEIEYCGKAGVKSAVIITAGFSETKADVQKLEEKIAPIAKKYGIRVIGPNCFGVINPYIQFNASIGEVLPVHGPIAFMSQSSTLCTSVIHYSLEEFLGFSNFISMGNKIDVDDATLLEYFHQDPNTKCIMIYMEDLRNTHNFFKTARKVAKEKPIIVLKSSYSEQGARAAGTDRGKIMGFEAEYELAFKQAGIFRAKTLSELFDASRALAYMPIPKGENIAILTNASGPGVLAADTMYRLGMKFAKLNDDTMEKLDKVCPPNWYAEDYVNIIGDASVFRYTDSLKILMNASEVDGVILLHTPTVKLNPFKLATNIVDIYNETKKPITASFVGMINKVSENFLDSHGIPEIEYPERAVFAMYALVERMKYLKDK